jgi:Tfp pilus assembly protein FimT
MIELLIVVCLIGLLSSMALFSVKASLNYHRLSGDARALQDSVAVTKMRAASAFTQARLYGDLAGNTYHLETWNKTTSTWTNEGGNGNLATGNSFGFGAVANAPPNSQTVIGQAAACQNPAGAVIASTTCVLFNSRGIPVDTTGTPTAQDALYVTDGEAVYSVTLSATGITRVWRAQIAAAANWLQQ